MLAVFGNVLTSMVMSEPVGDNVSVAELLPPAVVPPLESLSAPVTTVTVAAPADVGVPLTGQLMLAPATTVAGGAGVHAPTVNPGGRPEMVQLALTALAVADALLVQLIVPV